MTSSTPLNDPMPVWLDDDHIDPKWISHHTKLPCTQCTVQDVSNETRRGKRVRDGATLKLSIEDDETESPKTLILKQVPEQGRPLSQYLGLAREAFFYNQLATSFLNDNNTSIIPKIYYSYGNMETGAKVVVMEDLSEVAVDSGVFFGPGNPNNWNRDLPALAARAGPDIPSAARVAKRTFVELAQVHAKYWCRKDLLDEEQYSWMRGHAWLQGKGKESWEASQGLSRQFWKACLEREKKGSETKQLKWDPVVRTAVEKCIDGISWEAQLERLNPEEHWTVVHGDCWPGNFMWMIHEKEEMLKLLDWEMVGLGSGPQDLGQYVLSNMDPAERRECEEDLIKTYYEELKKCGVTNVDWDYCWMEYKVGGLERWIWFLIYFAGQDGPIWDWAQFFHDQISAFMKDHKLTADDLTQGRP